MVVYFVVFFVSFFVVFFCRFFFIRVTLLYSKLGKNGGCRAVFADSVLFKEFESFLSPVKTFVCCVCPFVDEVSFVQIVDNMIFF